MSQSLNALRIGLFRGGLPTPGPRAGRDFIKLAGLAGPPGGLLARSTRRPSAGPTLRGMLESAASSVPEVAPRLRDPVEEARQLAEQGLEEWAASLPKDDWADIVDRGTPLRWVDGKGWVEG